MNIEKWLRQQGFMPNWLVGKRIRIVKWYPIVEEGFFTLVDNLIVSKVTPFEMEFENGEILQILENPNLLMDFKIQVYKDK